MLFVSGSVHPDVTSSLRDCRRTFWSVALFSGVVNLLMLAGPLYMLQVYDRVLTSRSIPTLIALTALLVGAYAFQGALDLIRSRVVVRAATLLDHNLSSIVHRAVIRLALTPRPAADAQQPVRDLDQIRAFLTSAGPIAMVDFPWIPVFLFVCFLIHPWLGMAATAGGVILFTMTLLTERASRDPARNAAREGGARSLMIEADRRNSETIAAMGMAGILGQRWTKTNNQYVSAIGRASDVTGSYSSVSKILRLLLQSMMLGLGAYLVIKQELSAGAMIAASIMMGRALAPIETAIANWRGFVSARQSIARLSESLRRTQGRVAATELPKPRRELQIEQVIVAAPGSPKPILTGVQFALQAGEAVGIIGPSGAGKTSLVRVLLGVWPAAKGAVRLDGAALDHWDPEVLGKHIGFVSQSVELFEGTVAENIARMSMAPDSELVLRAARAAGAHEMILKLPAGYDTKVGEQGAILSGGQRQRIALARALYGDPFLIILDEPNSNLDGEGEAALVQSIFATKARGGIVALIAHRPSLLAACDKVVVLNNGQQQAFGPRDEVMRKITRPVPLPSPAAGNLKVVGQPAGGRP